jgi:hypothetical protein
MSFDQAIYFKRYNAAVALNNTGVALLKRQCYGDAMDTFKDSFSFIRKAFPEPVSHADPSSQENTAFDAEAYNLLYDASQRLAAPMPEECLEQELKLRFFSDNDMLPEQEFVDIAVHDNPCTSSPVAIQIDRQSNDFEDINLDVDCTIILHNYALACRRHSRTDKAACNSEKLAEGAFKVSYMACGILGHHRAILTSNQTEMRRLIILSFLVLQHMIQLRFELDMPHEGPKYAKKLGHIRAAFIEVQRPLLEGTSRNKRSAPAA